MYTISVTSNIPEAIAILQWTTALLGTDAPNLESLRSGQYKWMVYGEHDYDGAKLKWNWIFSFNHLDHFMLFRLKYGGTMVE